VIRAVAQVSVTGRLGPKVKAAVAGIDDGAWNTIAYPEVVSEETTSVNSTRGSRRGGVHCVQLTMKTQQVSGGQGNTPGLRL